MELVLDGADIKSLKGAAIVATGGETRLVLQEGTENYLSDAKKYADGEFTDGCIYSEKSLVISGKGKLKIDGNYADGISCGEKLSLTTGRLLFFYAFAMHSTSMESPIGSAETSTHVRAG